MYFYISKAKRQFLKLCEVQTMKKNEKQPNAVQGTAMGKTEQSTEQQTKGTLVILKPSEPSPEDLKTENERLKRIIERVPSNLEDRINYYNQKNDWINKLSRIEREERKLKTLLEEVGENIEEDEFLSDSFSFAILRKQQYGNNEELLKIHNPVVVGDVLHLVLKRLQDKRDELQINIAN